jgi:hypothetical protein
MNKNSSRPNHNHHPDQDMLQAYLDQILGSEDSHALEEHLASCDSCRSTLESLEMVVVRLESLPEVTLEMDLSTKIINSIREGEKFSIGITWTVVIEAIVAGIVLGLLIPAIRSAIWIPRLVDTQNKIQATISIFLAQLVSNWMQWWAELQLSLIQLPDLFSEPYTLPAILPSPWILILLGGGIGILANILLLRSNFQLLNTNRKG